MSGMETKRSACAICSQQCPLEVRVKDGHMCSVEGSRLHPFEYGGICAKGAASRQYVYNKERLLYPMKQTGKKGEGKFQRISWEEAGDLIAQKLTELKEQSGPESVIFYAGYPKWFRPALLRFSNAFGSPNYCTESSTCFQAVNLAWGLVFGGHVCPPDLKHTKTLLVWGKNLYHSVPDSSAFFHSLREQSVTVIAVDARHSVTAHDADIRLQPFPGTDGALALSMASVIIGEGLYHKEFIDQYVYGFEEYKNYVSGFEPEKAQKITGVPAELIRKAARQFACHGPASIMFSASTVVHHINGVQNQRAVFSLLAITGNYDIDGGNVLFPDLQIPCPEMHGIKRLDQMYAVGQQEYPVWFDLPCEEANGSQLADSILYSRPYPLRGLFSLGMNHRMWPQPEYMQKALASLDFYVNTDLFMTDSCKYADIVLPACTGFERETLVFRKEGFVELTQKAIEPLGESRNDIMIIQYLMKKMGLKDEALGGSYDDYLNYVLGPSGINVNMLRDCTGGCRGKHLMYPSRKVWEHRLFDTPSGKIELKSQILEKRGFDGLPIYRDFRKTELYSTQEFPLILNTGSRKPQWFHARLYRSSWICGLESSPLIEIHPEDGKKYGIADGQKASVISPAGKVSGYAAWNISQLPGVVHIYHGKPGADANDLIDVQYHDPISGFPGYKSYFCKIEPEEERGNENVQN